jgi:hypothetical protein
MVKYHATCRWPIVGCLTKGPYEPLLQRAYGYAKELVSITLEAVTPETLDSRVKVLFEKYYGPYTIQNHGTIRSEY